MPYKETDTETGRHWPDTRRSDTGRPRSRRAAWTQKTPGEDTRPTRHSEGSMPGPRHRRYSRTSYGDTWQRRTENTKQRKVVARMTSSSLVHVIGVTVARHAVTRGNAGLKTPNRERLWHVGRHHPLFTSSALQSHVMRWHVATLDWKHQTEKGCGTYDVIILCSRHRPDSYTSRSGTWQRRTENIKQRMSWHAWMTSSSLVPVIGLTVTRHTVTRRNAGRKTSTKRQDRVAFDVIVRLVHVISFRLHKSHGIRWHVATT